MQVSIAPIGPNTRKIKMMRGTYTNARWDSEENGLPGVRIEFNVDTNPYSEIRVLMTNAEAEELAMTILRLTVQIRHDADAREAKAQRERISAKK